MDFSDPARQHSDPAAEEVPGRRAPPPAAAEAEDANPQRTLLLGESSAEGAEHALRVAQLPDHRADDLCGLQAEVLEPERLRSTADRRLGSHLVPGKIVNVIHL